MDTSATPFIGISRHRLLIDGEGITTLVAFYGCPLRCRYCLNPQSWHADTECTFYTPEQLYEKVRIDELYFLATHGGITFGGGEPYLHSEFIAEFRKLCGPQWRITLETSLYTIQEKLEMLFPIVDDYIIDIKDINPAIYKKYTTQSNQPVIDHLQWLVAQGKADRMLIRLPLIEGYNTQQDRELSREKLKAIGLKHFDFFTYTINRKSHETRETNMPDTERNPA